MMSDDVNIEQQLAKVAEVAEREADAVRPLARNRTHAADPSQVYSIRMPVDRLEELRRLAKSQHKAPTKLMRDWVIERLDRELSAPGSHSSSLPVAGPFADHFIIQAKLVATDSLSASVEVQRVRRQGVAL